MKHATLFSIGCLATACWSGAVSRADACTCSAPETLVARDASAAVFEGTVVDQRITLASDGVFWFPIPEQDIIVRRVWKGVSADPPISTFAERSAEALTIPATLPPSRRLRAVVAAAAAYYVNASLARRFHPPLGWGPRLLLCVLLLQVVSAIIFVSRRLLRRSLLLCATSAMTIVVLLLWTGLDVVLRPGMSALLSWR
jgi:hypothetical protein